jgi:serine/threonine-protein kinase
MQCNSDDLASLSRLLDEAIDLPPDELARWLKALPAEQQHLREKLSEMLARRRSETHEGFLADGPKLHDAESDPSEPRADQHVGPYLLNRELGRGGMGTVWLATRVDGALERQVALKLPRTAWGAGLAQRMARERDIVAQLEHPNIARLYDAGVDDLGRPYLAFEFVDGSAIDLWCNTHGLAVDARLRLFVQVVRAVAYAHAHLVVHRDLKPSNVLVTEDGQVHLLDFGIAKLLTDATSEGHGLTEQWGRALTPRYASPEQLAGETITVQSDVYSLGVLLYALLTGHTPYALKRDTIGGLEEAMREGEPPLASTRVPSHRRALRGEIDAILAKALKRSPGERYATADALAVDLQRHLDGERVLAQRDSLVYRAFVVARRHRGVIAGTLAVLIVASGGAVVSIIQSHRADLEAEHARIVKEFVVEVFRVDQNGADKGDGRRSPPETLLQHGAQLIDTKFAGKPKLQAELYGVVGSIYSDMGASQAAVEFSDRQVQKLIASSASDAELSRAELSLATALVAEGRLNEADKRARQVLAQSVDEPTIHSAASVLIARAQFELGHYDQVEMTLDDFDHSRSKDSALDASPARADALRAEMLGKRGRDVEAMARFRAAIAEAIGAEGPGSPTAIDIRLEVARWLLQYNRSTESRSFAVSALESLRKSGATGQIRAALEEARLTLGWFRYGDMKFDEARQTFERERVVVARIGLATPDQVKAVIDFEYGACASLWGDTRFADPLITSAAKVLRSKNESLTRGIHLAAYQGNQALDAARDREAEAYFRELLRLRDFESRNRSPLVALDWIYLAISLDHQRRFDEAKAVLDGSPDYSGIRGANNSLPSNEIRSARARIELDRGNPAAAIALMPPQAEDVSVNLSYFEDQTQLRGEILCALGRHKEGLELMNRAISKRTREDVYIYDLAVAHARAMAGLCALEDGQRASAEEWARLARSAFATQGFLNTYYSEASERLDELLSVRHRSAQ